MLKLRSKKIFTILRSNFLFLLTYDLCNLPVFLSSDYFSISITETKMRFKKLKYNLSHGITSRSNKTPCNEIDKPLVVYGYSNVT